MAWALLLSILLAGGARGAAAGQVAGRPEACSQLLANGGFEAGAAGWTQSSAGGYDLISRFNPRTGAWGAYLGGTDAADDRLSQALTLPAGAASVTLRAWQSLETEEPAGVFDTLTVSLLRPNGAVLADLLTVDNTAPTGIWEEAVADLTPYAGQAVILRFQVRTNATNATAFFVDDVTVTACSSGSRWIYLPRILVR